MFRAGYAKAVAGPSSPVGERHSVIARELNCAATEGDNERVKQLLEQLLSAPSRRGGEKLREQLAAIEDLFYAMRTMADTDPLTGLHNLRGFECMASRMLRSLIRQRRGAFFLYVDVDDLQVINESLGHGAGDRLLTAAAHVLRSACGEDVVIGRIGGAGFALLARESANNSYDLIRQRIRDAVAACNSAGQQPRLSVSIGVADFDPLRPASVAFLMDRADRAMYQDRFRKAPKQQPNSAASTRSQEETPVNRARVALGEVHC